MTPPSRKLDYTGDHTEQDIILIVDSDPDEAGLLPFRTGFLESGVVLVSPPVITHNLMILTDAGGLRQGNSFPIREFPVGTYALDREECLLFIRPYILTVAQDRTTPRQSTASDGIGRALPD